MKNAISLVKQTFQEWSEDKASRLAAALSYYTIFSLAPLLVIAIAIAGYFFGQSSVRDQVMGQISGLVGQQGAATIQSLMESTQKPGGSLIATIIGVATLLLGASGVFGQLQDALNTIWDVTPEKKGLWGTIKDRFFSFSMVVGVGFLLMVSLIVSTAISAVNKYVSGLMPGMEILLQAVNLLVSFGIITLLFALIFKYIPDIKIAWKDVWIGAAVTGLLFTLGKWAIGLYLSNVSTSYGAAGSLIVVLLWVYYSSQILFMGGEFTQVYARAHGSRSEEADGARHIEESKRAQQSLPRREARIGERPSVNRPVEQPYLSREQTAYEARAGVKTAQMARAGVPVTGEDYTYVLGTQAGERGRVDLYPKQRKFVPLRAFASVAGFFKVLARGRR